MTLVTILGIDPGLAMTGYAVADVDVHEQDISTVREIGVLSTEKSRLRQIRKTSEDLARAQTQAGRLRTLISRHQVDLIAYEMVSATPHKLPTFSFGIMMGIVATLGRPIFEVLPYEVKKAATGNRLATKKDIIEWALKRTGRQKLDWPTSSRRNQLALTYRGAHITNAAEHPADALATIQAAILSEQFRMATAIWRV